MPRDNSGRPRTPITTRPWALCALMVALVAHRAEASSPTAMGGRPRCRVSASDTTAGVRVLVEVRIGRYASGMMMAVMSDCHGLLVPLVPLLHLAGIATEGRGSLVRGRLGTGERLEADVRRSIVRRGRSQRHVEPSELLETSDGVVASVRVIGTLLGLEVTYDESGATVDVRTPDLLPVAVIARRAARNAARRAVRDSTRSGGLRERLSVPRSAKARPGVALEYDVAVSRQTASV